MLAMGVFLSAMLTLGLCLLRYRSSDRLLRLMPDIALFLLQFVLLSWLTASVGAYEVSLPWAASLLIAAGVMIYVCLSAAFVFRRHGHELSPSSIKEALDGLDTGLCFCDPDGRIVLINYAMGELTAPLIGGYPRTIAEIDQATEPCRTEGDLYRLSDTIRQIRRVELTAPSLIGYTQTTVQDVTALCNAASRLREESDRLKAVNSEMRLMMERLADRIREEETLTVKRRIHDDIGASLIAIQEIMKGGDEDMDVQLNRLKNAVSYFSHHEPQQAVTFDSLTAKARSMGVRIRVSGDLPDDGKARELMIAAVSESVTNCVRHAGGDEVYVHIDDGEDVAVTITNNGMNPAGEIREGGGLSTLRRLCENNGAAMSVASVPRFTLTLRLKKEKVK